MNFFNDLLESYSLLKKRKLHIPPQKLNEKRDGDSISFSEWFTRARDGDETALTVVTNTNNDLKAIFPGVPFPEPGGVDGVDAASEKTSARIASGGIVQSDTQSIVTASKTLSDQSLHLVAGSEEVTTGDPKPANGNGANGSETKDPCSGGVIWAAYGSTKGEKIVSSECKLNAVAATSYRQKIADYWAAAGNLGQMAGETTDPKEQYLLNSSVGSKLLSLFSETDVPEGVATEAKELLLKLMDRGWDADADSPEAFKEKGIDKGAPVDDFFNPERETSIFGILYNTFVHGTDKEKAISKDEERLTENVVADSTQALASLSTMLKSLDIANDKDANVDSKKWMNDNLFYVDGTLYFSCGDDTSVTFTIAQAHGAAGAKAKEGRQKFLDIYSSYNNLIGLDPDIDNELYEIPTINRSLYNNTRGSKYVTDAVTDITEEVDQIACLVHRANMALQQWNISQHELDPSKGLGSQDLGKVDLSKVPKEILDMWKSSARMYSGLRTKFGDSLLQSIVGEAQTWKREIDKTNIALTDEWEGMNLALDQLHSAWGGKGDLDFITFAKKMMELRGPSIQKANPDYIMRVGGGGETFGEAGKSGFKSDQVYIYNASTPDAEKRARKLMTETVIERNKDGEPLKDAKGNIKTKQVNHLQPPVNLKDFVTGSVTKEALAADPKAGEKAWVEFQRDWGKMYSHQGITLDDASTGYVGYETLKCSTSERITLGKTSPAHKICGFISKELDTYLGGTATGRDKRYLDGMVDMLGLDPNTGPATLTRVNNKLKNIQKMYDDFNTLRNTTTPNLKASQVRDTLFTAIGGDENPLGLTKAQIKILSSPEDSKARQKLEKKKLLKKIQQTLLLESVKKGLDSKTQGARDDWKYAAALMMLSPTYDRDNAKDGVMLPLADQSTSHFRNGTLRNNLAEFLASKHPLNLGKIKFDTEQLKIGSLAFKLGSSGSGKEAPKAQVVYSDEEARSLIKANKGQVEKLTRDSIEYSPTELMNKLLEVQQLMFSHLIKE